MPETMTLSARKPYGMFAFWGLHTLMLVLFLILEANGFHLLVSNLFYFTWIAVWIMHGLTVMLLPKRGYDMTDSDAAASGFWWRMILGAHSALYVAFGPVLLVWLLITGSPARPETGEGQSLWFYPAWLIVLLAHGAYVMIRERQQMSAVVGQKRKRDVPSLKRLMEIDADAIDDWEMDEDDSETKRKR